MKYKRKFPNLVVIYLNMTRIIHIHNGSDNFGSEQKKETHRTKTANSKPKQKKQAKNKILPQGLEPWILALLAPRFTN